MIISFPTLHSYPGKGLLVSLEKDEEKDEENIF